MTDGGRGSVRVWTGSLRRTGPALRRCRTLLSEDERLRAARFVCPAVRERFVLARGLLRILIGHHLAAPPEGIVFEYTPLGRPLLAPDASGRCPLEFSVSHSGCLAMYAFSDGAAVGIDVERQRRGLDGEGIAARFFGAAEAEPLARTPPRRRQRAWFEAWTCKEALLKALGIGIGAGLDQVEIVEGTGRLSLARCSIPGVDPDAWSIVDVSPGRGYVAALAVNAAHAAVSRFHWCWETSRGLESQEIGHLHR